MHIQELKVVSGSRPPDGDLMRIAIRDSLVPFSERSFLKDLPGAMPCARASDLKRDVNMNCLKTA